MKTQNLFELETSHVSGGGSGGVPFRQRDHRPKSLARLAAEEAFLPTPKASLQPSRYGLAAEPVKIEPSPACRTVAQREPRVFRLTAAIVQPEESDESGLQPPPLQAAVARAKQLRQPSPGTVVYRKPPPAACDQGASSHPGAAGVGVAASELKGIPTEPTAEVSYGDVRRSLTELEATIDAIMRAQSFTFLREA